MLCLCLLRPVCIIMSGGWSFGLVCKAPTDLSISIYIMMQWDSALSEACEYVPYGADGTRLQHDREGSLMELWQAFSHPVPDRGHTTGCSCVLFFVTVKASWIIPPVLEWAIWMKKSYDFSCVERHGNSSWLWLILHLLNFATWNLATCFHDPNW